MDGFGRSHRQAGWGARRHRPVFALVALVAVFLQVFVVQTHVHGPAPFTAGIEQTGDAEQHVVTADEHQIACSLCQTLASSGAALSPNPNAALAAERDTAVAILALTLAPRAHSHSWQSRAPPEFL